MPNGEQDGFKEERPEDFIPSIPTTTDLEEFGDLDKGVANFKILDREPKARDMGEGQIVISDISGVIKIHVKNGKGEIKSVALT